MSLNFFPLAGVHTALVAETFKAEILLKILAWGTGVPLSLIPMTFLALGSKATGCTAIMVAVRVGVIVGVTVNVTLGVIENVTVMVRVSVMLGVTVSVGVFVKVVVIVSVGVGLALA